MIDDPSEVVARPIAVTGILCVGLDRILGDSRGLIESTTPAPNPNTGASLTLCRGI